MEKQSEYTSIKFIKENEYQQIVKLRTIFRKRLGMPKLSLRETIMILVNKELNDK